MDINEQLQPIVASIIDSLKGTIEAELRDQISNEIIAKIANTEFDSIVQRLVEQQIRTRLDNFNFVSTSDEQLQKIVAQLTDQINKNLTATANQQISSYINQKLAAVNVTEIIGALVQNKVGSMLQTTSFPEKSISHNSIDFSGLKLTGDQVSGGIITNFGSTGIEDLSTCVQMTLMDRGTAFEGPLFAPQLTVKGDISLNGRLVINGEVSADAKGFLKLVEQTSQAVKELLTDDLFSGFSDIIFKKMQADGIDLDKITQGGKEIVSGNRLGYHIIDTNIRRLGVVNDLQTSGENLLVDTLYVTQGRVGVNTIDPTAVLSVWDQEVEVVVNKRSQDTGYVGTPRSQQLVIGANNKQNILLDPDGSVEIENLRIGNTPMSSASAIPNYPAITGTIVWNESPMPGSAIGWVCLGATQWASFGKVG
jgi:hypothetical protein